MNESRYILDARSGMLIRSIQCGNDTVEIIVNVSPLYGVAGLGPDFLGVRLLPLTFDSINRKPSDGLHISSTLQSICLGIVLCEVSNMTVASKELDRRVPFLTSNGLVYGLIFWSTRSNMACNQEEVNILSDRILKPLLLNSFLHWLNNCIVGIPCKVEQKSKGKNPYTLVLSCKLAKSLRHWNCLPCLWIYVIEVRSQVIPFEVWHGLLIFSLCSVR